MGVGGDVSCDASAADAQALSQLLSRFVPSPVGGRRRELCSGAPGATTRALEAIARWRVHVDGTVGRSGGGIAQSLVHLFHQLLDTRQQDSVLP